MTVIYYSKQKQIQQREELHRAKPVHKAQSEPESHALRIESHSTHCFRVTSFDNVGEVLSNREAR